MRLPTATYRLQLRSGVDFARAAGLLPYLRDLGVSDLYLSPIFTAVAGSTHGYDVTDPTAIDPVLGGEAGFSALAAQARAHGIGIILDIVPNHTAFSVENPWLREVLRHGSRAAHAGHFDIDWSRGPLVLPYLADTLEATLQARGLRIVPQVAGHAVTDGSMTVPLAPGPMPPEALHDDPATLREVLSRQHWRLTHWEHGRDGITHRRFFNVTDLIGMRVEDPAVFDDTHALILDLVGKGEVQGLRVDHIDGLADPAAYLRRLRARLPDVPIWVEKILTGDERLPDWPVQGTTGYEAGRAIARLLTDAGGLAHLDGLWRQATGQTGTFAKALRRAKADVMEHDLSAELVALKDLARDALTPAAEAGDEALREAVLALLSAFPRYRTYFTADVAHPDDAALMAGVAEDASARVRGDRVVRALSDRIATGGDAAARRLQTRFQQVTGALLAKAHEDTAGFRWNRFLAANEVGVDPDEATLPLPAFNDWMAERRATMPGGLTLTSSHDTKRAEDARMRLVAISHLPDAFADLWAQAMAMPGARALDPNLVWYVVQSVLALWQPARADLAERLALHIEKAMREAKLVTSWSHPDTAAEAPAIRLAQTLAILWEARLPDAAARLIGRGAVLSLQQLVLKLMMPGIPDIYQGTEVASFHLTDPDNRLAVDFDALSREASAGLDQAKARTTRRLLRLRRSHPEFFHAAVAEAELSGGQTLTVTRRSGDSRSGDGRSGEDWVEVRVDGTGVTLRGRICDETLGDVIALETAPASHEPGGNIPAASVFAPQAGEVPPLHEEQRDG